MVEKKTKEKFAKWTIGEEFMKLVLRKTEEFYKSTEEENWTLAKLRVFSLINISSFYLKQKRKYEETKELKEKIKESYKTVDELKQKGDLSKIKDKRDEIIDIMYEIVEIINILFSEFGAYLIVSVENDPVKQSLMM